MQKILIVATSRVIKLFANTLKMLNYPLYWIFPKIRFTLPEYSPPLFKNNKKKVISSIIWQTNFTNRVTLPVYLNYLFNRLMAPDFEYRFMSTEARNNFINAYYPDVLPHYNRLQIGAAQADLWRVLVLHKFGGVYLDIDAHQIWPLSQLIGSKEKEIFVTTRRGEFSNYFIASAPANPNLAKLIDQIVENIKENTLTNVFHITGPGVFNMLLNPEKVPTVHYRYAVNQGSFTNEHFQYIDKPQGKWNKEQRKTSVIRPESENTA
ncbi:glycosyltransferase family 32 protein [Halovibrio sp. HP20-50]|uniref:glycosyltransferase family 32 protein n=1 Tax=Halovibrio sp. HP20-59 TaxID=3080275 RepID=UPI00294B4A73|nr:glycosyltransferase [Halovibrio sp. HP20-59]MEA2119178.1 glycosyltransferase [Halovibrio sp. HP20-59]